MSEACTVGVYGKDSSMMPPQYKSCVVLWCIVTYKISFSV